MMEWGGLSKGAPVIAASGRYSQRAIRTAREPSFWQGSDTLLKLLTRHLSTAALLWALPCTNVHHPVKASLLSNVGAGMTSQMQGADKLLHPRDGHIGYHQRSTAHQAGRCVEELPLGRRPASLMTSGVHSRFRHADNS